MVWIQVGRFLRNEHGEQVSASILDDFEYWNYLQRSIGHCAPWIPAPAKPKRGCQWSHLQTKIDYLLDLYEAGKGNRA